MAEVRYAPVKGSTPVPRRVCNVVFHELHQELRKYLNFHSIYPFLNTHHLLPSLDHTDLTSLESTLEKKVDIVLAWLPKSDKKDYLTPFVHCLRESSKEAGSVHIVLAEQLEILCAKELERYSSWKKKKHASSTGCALSLLSLAIITLFFVVGTVIISFLFPLNSKDTKIIIHGNHTMELNPFIADKWWVKSMAVWIDPMTPNYKCPGEVTVVSNMMECGKLPRVYVVKEGGQSPNYLYALPGSVINITVPDNTRLATTNIWFTSNIETYIDLAAQLIDGGNEFRCNNINTPGAYCYPTKHYLGRTLNFQIKESGFYFYLLTNNSDSDNITPGYIEGIRWSYQLIHYNYSSIMANYDVKSYSISSSPASIRLSHFFHFGNAPSCVLFNFDCTPLNNRPQLEISNFRRRMDVVSLSVLVYVSTVVIISCVCLIPTSSVLIWLRRLS